MTGADPAGRWPPPGTGHRVDAGGVHWHAVVLGDGPPLLAVHGTGASSHSFRRLAPLLATRFTVVAPDLPGHAESRPAPGFVPSLPGVARALAALVEALGVAPSVALGHSAGVAVLAAMCLDGAVAPRLVVGVAAALAPFRGLARVVLPPWAALLSAANAAPWIAAHTRRGRRVENILRSTGASLAAEDVAAYEALAGRPEHVAGALAMMRHWRLEPLYAALPELDARVLLVAGGRDRAVGLSEQRRVCSRLRHGALVVVPAAGHLVHEEQPETVAALVLEHAERAVTV